MTPAHRQSRQQPRGEARLRRALRRLTRPDDRRSWPVEARLDALEREAATLRRWLRAAAAALTALGGQAIAEVVSRILA